MPYAQCANSVRVRTSTVLCFAFRISFNSVRKQNVLCCAMSSVCAVSVWTWIFQGAFVCVRSAAGSRSPTTVVCVRDAAGTVRVPVHDPHVCERAANVWQWQSSSRDTNQRRTEHSAFAFFRAIRTTNGINYFLEMFGGPQTLSRCLESIFVDKVFRLRKQ